ncbi:MULTISPECIES: BON domain-containing protein [unclassified Mesorhizobium]|jgi:osmotically-inducible protein OsmY|uniref:BON domain-containing protein n=1 Tax=unclassified Mesorhizobium TaxID=325217 RepID=UPI000FE3D96A|nr:MULTISPECIES: BON domain-containing protein [unclassified Mesorhizobium]MDG4892204.1 BON domain-containing protein [Mesorhizobium sp. WSM4976]RWH68357.1 MAG: BON domain-containing protein [Mesorhizobium sp.]RWL25065.1 MAG: BON domain-containing protein [Mesorhizobium sp.]RWL27570.1 MAG: BON domain-containing protein [Mesorhizobium sp.]RWL36346.1 MAG: BON domain-containing protein [Mesorhizobium sp.]
MSDSILKQDIIDELDFEPSVDAANIGVAVDDGVVTLTGHVPTYAQKVKVEDVVRNVKGVKAIAQEMEVRPFGTHKTADDEIAKRAVNTIAWHTSIPGGTVQIGVQGGWIKLTGKVEWQYQKTAAEDAVRHLAGVIGVTNQIEIKPRPSTHDIKQRIENALKRNAELEAQAIKVNVIGNGAVRLEGRVHAWSERRAAERAAWSAAGVKTVEDRITIG